MPLAYWKDRSEMAKRPSIHPQERLLIEILDTNHTLSMGRLRVKYEMLP